MSALVWGVKASLVGYVRGMSDGRVELDGVTETEGGFVFPEMADGPTRPGAPGAAPGVPRESVRPEAPGAAPAVPGEGAGPEAPGAAPDAATRRFSGRITFAGHNGMMRVAIADPWIEASRSGAVLSIADPDDPAQRLAFARIASFDGARAIGTTLTADGADLFFGPYREGTELDDPVLRA